ncbi:unnamed protein product [Lampetra fluviatilis]
MASSSSSQEDNLSCSICRKLFDVPVSLACGHNFCKKCVEGAWDAEAAHARFTCPQCRRHYAQKPELNKNVVISDLVEKFKGSRRSQCSDHTEPMRYYCQKHVRLVCTTCMLVGGHKGCHAITMEEQQKKTKEAIAGENRRMEMEKTTEENSITSLRNSFKSFQDLTENVKDRITESFALERRLLDEEEQEALRGVQEKSHQELSRIQNKIEEHVKKIETLIEDIGNLDKVMALQDPIAFLEDEQVTSLLIKIHSEERNARSRRRDTMYTWSRWLFTFWMGQLQTRPGQPTRCMVHVSSFPCECSYVEPICSLQATAGKYLLLRLSKSHGCSPTLNAASSHPHLQISEDRRTVKQIRSSQTFLNDSHSQVLGSESFSSGRRYWEVDVSNCGRLPASTALAMPDPVAVRVLTMDADMDFEIQPTATGKQLLDQVARTIGLKEVWYFGLAYDNKHGDKWLSFNKKVLSQVKSDASAVATLRLWVRFYPEDVDEIIQDVTLRLLYLQTHRAVVSDALHCPTETCVLLASYAAQAALGDLDTTVYQSDEELLPDRVVQQFSLSRAQWEEKVTRWHAEHVGMSRRQAMVEYLSVAQDLEAYGVSSLPHLQLAGLPPLARSLRPGAERLRGAGSEIAVLTTEGTRFIIKSCDEDSPDFEFLVPSVRANRRVLSACAGNHELYARRHGDTLPEITQLRMDEGRPHPRELPPLPHGDLTDGERWDTNSSSTTGTATRAGRSGQALFSAGSSRRSSSSSVSSGIYEVPDELKKVQDSKVEMRNSQLKAVAASLVESREGQHQGQQQAGQEEATMAVGSPKEPTLHRAARFHTLRRIRRGTTKQRIDEYEAL